MRRLAAAVLASAFLAVSVLGTALLGAAATSTTAWAGAALGTPAGAAPAAPAAPAARSGFELDLRLDDMVPRVITADGPATLTVSGELTNIGDEAVDGLKVRLQRGDRLRTEGELRTALSGDDAADTQLVEFTELTDSLGPGQRLPVRLNVSLRGSSTTTLALQRPGVYPLLINVNSESDDGERTRVAAVRLLLPVLGLPAVPLPGTPAAAVPGGAATPKPGVEPILGAPAPRAPAAVAPGDGAVPGGAAVAGGAAVVAPPPADPAASNPITVLYPLAGRPHRLPTGPGEAVVLGADERGGDELAVELSDGGRLDGLLDALESAAPVGSAVRDAMCLAIDPDLVQTVAEMRGGYRLRGSDGTETEGGGTEAAAKWLSRLRADAAGRCVLAIPFADADLVALSRAGLADLVGYASRGGVKTLTELLGTPVRADLTWPADGLLDERSLTDFLNTGGRGAVLSSDAVSESNRRRGGIGGTVRLNLPRGKAGPPVGLLADPLLTLAAGPPPPSAASADQVGASGNRGLGSLSTSMSVSPAGTGAPLSGQDLTGALVFRALDTDVAGSPLLVAPPHRWNTSGEDARELLASVARLITSGNFRATPLVGGPGAPDLAAGANAGSLVYPLRAGAREIPAKVTARLRAARDTAAELRSAAVSQPGVGYTPAQTFDPVTEGLLRAASAVSRGREDESSAATKVIVDRVRLLRSSVRVLEPPSPFALGDREAPLPITLANGLPVAMRVRVALGDTPGLRTEAIPAQQIPPLGRLQLRVNAQLSRSGQFSVEAKLTTLAGAQLGPVSRLQLRSTAYGTITLWLTGAAGALLVILAGRRISRRIRAARTRPIDQGPGRPIETNTPDLTQPLRSQSGSPRPVPMEHTLGPLPPLDLPPLDLPPLNLPPAAPMPPRQSGSRPTGRQPSNGFARNDPSPPNGPSPPPGPNRSGPPPGPNRSGPLPGPNRSGPPPNGARPQPPPARPSQRPPQPPPQPPQDPGRRPSGTRGR